MFYKGIIPALVMISSAIAADFTTIPFLDAAGKQTSLADYDGKVVLLVNVASKCGMTKQYAGLEKLYDEYKEEGLVILGFPCNDFGGQEPGSIEEIQKFCRTKYDVSFPLMAKIHVKGEEQHALYRALTGPEGPFPGDTKWNFGKILLSKDGKPVARFEPKTSPGGEEIVEAIRKELTK